MLNILEHLAEGEWMVKHANELIALPKYTNSLMLSCF